jgi:tRNA(Ile)-lysidine synthase TilS/MesJ
MNDDKISEALGLRPLLEAKKEDLPVVVEEKEILPIEAPVEEDDTIRDIEQARGNIKNIIEQGDDALKEMISLAKQSESPRAFEVASTLMKTLLDANKDFVEMSTKKKYAKEELMGPKEAAQTNITNNNLILSTADLLKMIKGE